MVREDDAADNLQLPQASALLQGHMAVAKVIKRKGVTSKI